MRAKVLHRDTVALTDQATFLSNKINFLLDATLGMINIEQNNIIKIFSVAAGVFLPPTLIASIYGMNFKHMPELNWPLGFLAHRFFGHFTPCSVSTIGSNLFVLQSHFFHLKTTNGRIAQSTISAMAKG